MTGINLLAILPNTANYALQSYSFGSGGSVSSSNTYSIEGSSGGINGQNSSTINTTLKPGYTQTQQANVPQLSALDNGSGLFYNKLHFVIDPQNNPPDATYLISVSTDNFSSNITYLQPDGTLSSNLLLSDYQTYNAFGGSTGSYIIGLLPSTTYYVRLLATQGKFTESSFGPTSTQVTAAELINFSLSTSTQTTPPYIVNIGSLSPSSITTSSQTINTTLSTNGASGGSIYVSSQYGGLYSPSTGYQINSVTNNLSNVQEGFGAQATGISQTSGGPLASSSSFNGTGNNVGALSTVMQTLFSSSGPISNGSGSIILKARDSSTTVAASDYQDTLTFVASASY